MDSLNTIEVAEYVKGLFEKVRPSMKFGTGYDGDGHFEVFHIIDEPDDESEWVATYCASGWLVKFTGRIDFMDEESIIVLIKQFFDYTRSNTVVERWKDVVDRC